MKVLGETRPSRFAGWSSGSDAQQRPAIAVPVILLVAVALVLRLYRGPTVVHDSLAIYWVWSDQFAGELARGVLYPRWLPLSNAGLGAPVFYYYPPLGFYLTAAFSLVGLSTSTSLFNVFGCAFAGSGIACWLWLKGRSDQPLLGALFFMAAPYHLFDYVDRGALAESVAILFIPVLAIGLRRIAERRGGIVATSLAFGAMIGSHLPLALLTAIFLVVPFAIRHRRCIVSFAISMALGIGAAAVYLFPALALGAYHDRAQLYRAAYLRTDYWSIFKAHWSDPNFTIIALVVGATLAAAIIVYVRLRDRWALLAIGITAVVAGLVPFFWSLPIIKEVQFPYRALPIAEFALATALARTPRGSSLGLKAAILPLIVSVAVLPGLYDRSVDLERLRTVHPDVYEYLPPGVLRPGETNATLARVLATRIPPPHVPGMVVEPRFYFPSWSCGSPEPRTKLLMHDPLCKPRLTATLPERLGIAISALSLLLLALMCAGVQRRKLLGTPVRTAARAHSK